MTSRSQKLKLKLNSRAIRALGLLKRYCNIIKKDTKTLRKFLKNRTPRNEETYKTYKNHLKPLKRDKRESFTQKNCGSLKVMREKHGKNPQSPQLFQLKLLSIKLTFLM